MNVVKKIMKISAEKLQKMLKAIASALNEFAASLGEKEENNEESQKLRSENNKLKNQLEKENSVIKRFQGIVDVMNVFENLPDKVKTELKNLLGEASPEDIVGCGLRLNNLQNFWEVARIHAVHGEIEVAKNLGKIFRYMISIFPKTNSNAQTLDISLGEPFDDKKHLHCEGKSRVSIEDVLVDGLVVKEDVVLKAIVR